MNRVNPAATARAAFTIIELLVVVTIITIVVLIALPRFASLIYAQEEQLASSLLTAAMKTTRDAAIRSPGDEDGAAVFFWRYQPLGPGRITTSGLSARLVIVPCIKVGTFTDDPRRLSNSTVQQSNDVQGIRRDIFMPVEGVDPVVLPRNWVIRGYAPPNTVEGTLALNANNPGDPRANWYEGNRYQTDEGNWLFPETDFYAPADDRVGNDRQTFMVRFKAGTGEVVTVPNETAIVVDVRPYYDGRDPAGSKQLYDAYDKTAFVKRILREAGKTRQKVLGRDDQKMLCSDVMLVRPVTQLAIYDENKLAAALGVPLDTFSGCLYKPPPALSAMDDPPEASARPSFVAGLTDAIRINQWIEGDTNFNDTVESAGGGDQPLSRIYSLERYTGVPRLLEVQP